MNPTTIVATRNAFIFNWPIPLAASSFYLRRLLLLVLVFVLRERCFYLDKPLQVPRDRVNVLRFLWAQLIDLEDSATEVHFRSQLAQYRLTSTAPRGPLTLSCFQPAEGIARPPPAPLNHGWES